MAQPSGLVINGRKKQGQEKVLQIPTVTQELSKTSAALSVTPGQGLGKGQGNQHIQVLRDLGLLPEEQGRVVHPPTPSYMA